VRRPCFGCYSAVRTDSAIEITEEFSWAGPRWQGGKEARKAERTYIDVLFSLGR
jgi:hypothetical protein